MTLNTHTSRVVYHWVH